MMKNRITFNATFEFNSVGEAFKFLQQTGQLDKFLIERSSASLKNTQDNRNKRKQNMKSILITHTDLTVNELYLKTVRKYGKYSKIEFMKILIDLIICQEVGFNSKLKFPLSSISKHESVSYNSKSIFNFEEDKKIEEYT